jgi:hypothetical protein
MAALLKVVCGMTTALGQQDPAERGIGNAAPPWNAEPVKCGNASKDFNSSVGLVEFPWPYCQAPGGG